MYHLDKQVQLQDSISLPTCMYRMEPLNTISKLDVASSYYGHSGSTLPGHTTTSGVKLPDSILKLEARQEGILRQLKELKQQVIQFEQTQGCPRIIRGTPAVGTAASHIPVKNVEVKAEKANLNSQHAAAIKKLGKLREELIKVMEARMMPDEEEEAVDVAEHHSVVLNVIKVLQEEVKKIAFQQNLVDDKAEGDVEISLDLHHQDVLKKVKALHGEIYTILRILRENDDEDFSKCICSDVGTSLYCTSQPEYREGVVHDLVISAHPKHAPYGLLILRQMLKDCGLPVYATSHVHSSIQEVGQNLKTQFADAPCGGRSSHQLAFTVQWKSVKSTDLMVNPIAQSRVVGEANVVRYISRLFPHNSPYNYEACGTLEGIAEVDAVLDTIQSNVLEGKHKDKTALIKQYNARLANSKWLLGGEMGIVDVFAWSAFKQTGLDTTAPAHLSKWSKALDQLAHMKTVKYYRGHGRKASEGGRGRKSSERKASESGGGRARKNSERKSAERKTSESGGRPRKNSERKASESSGLNRKNSESSGQNRKNSESSSSKPIKKEKSQKQPEITGVTKEVVVNGTLESKKQHLTRKEFEDYLKSHNIRYQAQDHEEVFTVDALMKCVKDMPGLHMKNLFLKDKKKKYYLFSVRHDVEVKLNEIAKLIGTKELRFADEKIMFDLIGVKQGCVTAYALVNDKDNAVQFLLDEEAMNEAHPFVNFHPLSNAATLGISPNNLKKFLALTGHKPYLLKL